MVTTVPVTLSAFLLPFAAHFRARGWRVDAMANGISSAPACVEAFDRVWDMPWSRSPLHPGNLVTAPKKVREIVAREGYDLVHVHTPVASFVTRLALRSMRGQGKPRVVYTAHGFHFYEGGPRLKGALFRKLEQWAGRWTDYLVVINREDEQAALRYGIVPPDRVRYMPGIGVDTGHYSATAVSVTAQTRVRQELGLLATDRLFLMVAELIPRKRPADALHALARLTRSDAHLALAGPGPLLEELKQLAARLGIAQRVHFLGYRKDIPALIQSSVATLLTSEQEGLPRSVMESMCQAVPVIGSRIRGMTDLLANGRGLLVPVGNVQGFADAMAWVLDHPGEARMLGERGRAGMAAYDLGNIVRLHEKLYDEALDGTPTSVAAPAVCV
jgi:glycosyltransferase involved in cell wall biosynthesis